jgi:RNA polymerase sigma-70 factor (ECF subfamily)
MESPEGTGAGENRSRVGEVTELLHRWVAENRRPSSTPPGWPGPGPAGSCIEDPQVNFFVIGLATPSSESMGDAAAQERFVSLLYPELKRIAAIRMRAERPDHTLQPTALVSELFLRLVRNGGVAWHSRSHFLAVASQLMRRLLIDYSRQHNASKRGAGNLKIQLDGLDLAGPNDYPDLLEIAETLDHLSKQEPRMAHVVDMHCFGGLTFQEIAEVLGIDERTAKRDWQVALARLIAQLRKGKAHDRRGMGAD